MPRLYPEALAFCVVWVALALLGWHFVDWYAGLALSVGLFLVVMPASALTLSRTGSFGIERAVRWGILTAAALALLAVTSLRG
jgi:hypothetical protein